jgi:heptosyltransferase-2
LKPKLLIVELWGLGDLVIATPFIRAASEKFDVTVLARPYATDLQNEFWPGVTVIPFTAPWTAFKHKYRLWAWPWKGFWQLRRLGKSRFDIGVSARWDPRDHVLMALLRIKQRAGFPRIGSQFFLSKPLGRPEPISHRYEYWRVLAQSLGVKLPSLETAFGDLPRASGQQVLIHSGAGQPVRVWPLERYQTLAVHLRQQGYHVQIACDLDQQQWWTKAGERQVIASRNVSELIDIIKRAGVFIGNDSGPGHLAAVMGVPTFTLFGPQLHEWFRPMHRDAEVIEGKPCPYKPCSDYCRFAAPLCLHGIAEAEILGRAQAFVRRHVGIAEL